MSHNTKTLIKTVMKKRILASLAIITLLVSCNKDIRTGEVDGFVEDRNVYLQFNYKWGGLDFYKDSTYTLGDYPIKMEQLKLVLTNFYFMADDGSITYNESEADVAITDLNQKLFRVAKLSNGTYAGTVGITVGFDSILDFTPPEQLPKYNPLSESGMYRGFGKSYNFIEMNGSVFMLSQDNNDSVPVLKPFPFKYQVAYSELAIEFDAKKNFSMTANKDVIFEVDVDLEALFGDIKPNEVFIINCDPNDLVDWGRAVIIRDALEEDAFKFLP